MILEDSSSCNQAVRRVYENEDLNTTTSLSKVFYLECNYDDVSAKDIILWDDILAAFKDVVHARSGAKILPFLKGRNFKTLDPLRIAAVPGVTLDVIVTGQLVRPESTSSQAQTKTLLKEMSLESPLNSPPRTPQKHGSASFNNPVTNAVERNPAYGLVEEALENYNHIDNPATAPRCRRPQETPNNQSPVHEDDDDDDDKAQYSPKKTPQNTLTPQEDASITILFCTDPDESSEQKDPVGQRRVGYLYDNGLGVNQSYSTAVEWFLLAAEQGDPQAQRNIGFMYYHGRGVPQNHSKAMDWFQKAANQGNAAAHYNVGLLYEHGLGVSQDFDKAVEWYFKAADKNDPDSLFKFGYFYDNGFGVTQNYSAAMESYLKAAEQGNPQAERNIEVV
ncbi:hypothetical protein BGZ96_000260 [Linnemannia gamsii]|uniref:HCP-like protein n=1 Tax=Linnemannia gamsii TaxID=64522 RepID=A0ABQ7JPQ6_9FUNG|nr:hypothetical protein BGZ96_000260 [Linnemannia gamsii]